MSVINFDDRIQLFNQEQEEAQIIIEDSEADEWNLISSAEIGRLLGLDEDETKRVMNCGLFKLYRVGNEYRASEKSVKESQKIIHAITS